MRFFPPFTYMRQSGSFDERGVSGLISIIKLLVLRESLHVVRDLGGQRQGLRFGSIGINFAVVSFKRIREELESLLPEGAWKHVYNTHHQILRRCCQSEDWPLHKYYHCRRNSVVVVVAVVSASLTSPAHHRLLRLPTRNSPRLVGPAVAYVVWRRSPGFEGPIWRFLPPWTRLFLRRHLRALTSFRNLRNYSKVEKRMLINLAIAILIIYSCMISCI